MVQDSQEVPIYKVGQASTNTDNEELSLARLLNEEPESLRAGSRAEPVVEWVKYCSKLLLVGGLNPSEKY